jgi:hypothetical protein
MLIVLMTVSADLAAIVFAFFLNRFTYGNNAKAGFTSAFHLSNSGHCFSPNLIHIISLTSEQVFRYSVIKSLY